MNFVKIPFGTTRAGEAVTRFSLSNSHRMQVDICNIGCSILSIQVPDQTGVLRDVALGYDTIKEYEENPACFGCVVGRVGNRIKNASFDFHGKTFYLEKNDGKNHIHGGFYHFGRKFWDCTHIDKDFLEFSLVSPDGEGGYPGSILAQVSYSLSEENSLTITYTVKAFSPSICNLTNHNFFNLSGEGSPTILDHRAIIRSNQITEIDQELIPTGSLLSVDNTPFDFQDARIIGEKISSNHPQLIFAGGYDHNYVLPSSSNAVATIYSPISGICLDVFTTSPGMQFYTGNSLDGTLRGKHGHYYSKQSGFCLETQLFPDAIHHPNFPSCQVVPGHPQHYQTTFHFSTL